MARRKRLPSFMLLIEDIVCRRCSKAQAAEIYTLLDRDPGLRSRPPSALRKLETWTSAKQLTFLEKKEPKKPKGEKVKFDKSKNKLNLKNIKFKSKNQGNIDEMD